ncbi:hypothetical protein NTE_01453 [Candidatus Nitrososphaera evergladensis SR1]|uniref:Uncharacterized protein n=1 Tax=Candidatus Nitrososphaera evergladensis SR1 TaxID=1459636 RepID=A0A075MRS1_9ARCH|nr:hypothetical protein [Candidatus Nitrososphaera evergladensis]AIF83517.1 hypothetical protein NTE_01453 [Candidatus Nitrososphaera evergladensis SR1]
MDLESFVADVTSLADRMAAGEPQENIQRLDFVRSRLIGLYQRNLVKINHSAMELVCAKHLIRDGYSVDVEKQLTDILVCDVYATKGDGVALVEIETGFIPPEHALDPLSYYAARIASKIARYSKHSNKFVLATPPVSILPIPNLFRRPPRDRTAEEVKEVKALCDRYYSNPPIGEEEILNAHLHMVYIINIDAGRVVEMDIDLYLEKVGEMLAKGMAGISSS